MIMEERDYHKDFKPIIGQRIDVFEVLANSWSQMKSIGKWRVANPRSSVQGRKELLVDDMCGGLVNIHYPFRSFHDEPYDGIKYHLEFKPDCRKVGTLIIKEIKKSWL